MPDRSCAARLADAGYDVAGGLAALLCLPALPYLLWRGYGDHWAERLGRMPASLRGLAAAPVWIHAASVGETRAAGLLVDRLRAAAPGVPIVLSTTSTTGRAVAERDVRPDAVTLLPVDALRIVDHVLRAVRPRCLVLIETEIWPGLLRAAARLRVPIVVVSGRISPRAFSRYRRVRWLLRPALGRVARFGMQTAADAERIVALGAPADRVGVTGSLKAGRVAPATIDAPPIGGLSRRPVLVAASTQPGEEEFVLAACAAIWAERPDVLLVVAPRRPERFDMVARILADAGRRVQRRSAGDGAVSAEAEVFLLDTVGELVRFLPVACAVFVGGTIAPLGGHNVLEPAVYGKPVAFGPHTENVEEAARALCEGGGAVVVRQADDLGRLWRGLLASPEGADEMGRRAFAVAGADVRVIERTWALVAPFVEIDGRSARG